MMDDKINIIFMGTPEFAVPVLEKVHQKLGVKAVVTVPDRIQGRGMKLVPSDVSRKADKLGIPLLKPEKLKDEDFIEQKNKIMMNLVEENLEQELESSEENNDETE